MKDKQKARPPITSDELQRLTALEDRLQYRFNDKDLLRTALTHTSYSNELKAKNSEIESNERLEFLGDSILSVVTAEYLFNKFRHQDEGDLTRLRALAVCEDALFEYSNVLELGNCLYLGHGEEISNGRQRKSILADAFEAVLAAIYTESGMSQAKNMVLRFAKQKIEAQLREKTTTADYKTLLQTIVQQTPGDLLEYNLVGQDGPEHDRVFVMEALLNGNSIGRGEGRSKRQAEQIAAKQALELFGVKA